MSEKTSGISVMSLLGVLFIGLKLTGYIDWSWWLVTLPFWGGAAVFCVLVLVVFIIASVLD